jgi:hypothetical protein
MNRRAAMVVVVAAAAVLLAVSLWWWLAETGDGPLEDAVETGIEPRPIAVDVDQQRGEVDLYFPGRGGRLYPERREIELAEDRAARVEVIVREVLSGPRSEELRAPLPAGTTLDGVDLGDDGTAFVSLRSSEQTAPPSSGSKRELLMVFSLVDSIVLNVPDTERVALLWNGRQRSTFAGHVDTTRPLLPDTSLVVRRP